ncbi:MULTISPECIES: glycerol-3-phosphate 1-O-acyltransferase PlsY [unclassified Bartonella]|uniref:glycerol-3-phosphate 1-O-acyltransferase PlsY n=1 Tax=unclassified Bartonella TaxID=2645622 RepID=UPI0009991BA1|nr:MULTISPECIES: glycerol-3-phosphate 1-O-acyltransferase PlsY [unclassified Bartonella]AQX28047.1 acyl-phosphate glycerol-3-phosphate acyltransferase [Bartonella sp. JB15]AQX29322.1 acyl-phosphate glycerol-3-phosphate acyltransferase [Bartonella sp. JB63]
MIEVETLFQFNTWLIFLISYLIGSTPFGLLFTKFSKLGDIREIGSGNIGATNVLRTGNKKIAALTLLCDILKGAFVILMAKHLVYTVEIALLAGFLAFLGHIFPIWLKFKGGKGVATYLGICLGFYWLTALIFTIIWIGAFIVMRYSSFSSLMAVIITPTFVYYYSSSLYVACIIITMSILVIIKHHGNIRRLLAREENKVGITNRNK